MVSVVPPRVTAAKLQEPRQQQEERSGAADARRHKQPAVSSFGGNHCTAVIRSLTEPYGALQSLMEPYETLRGLRTTSE